MPPAHPGSAQPAGEPIEPRARWAAATAPAADPSPPPSPSPRRTVANNPRRPETERAVGGEGSRPRCPRCRRASGLLLHRPALGAYHPVYRCDARAGGCGYLWSPA